MQLGLIHLLVFALVGYFFIKPKLAESFMGWSYGYSPYGYGGFGRRYYAGYSTGGPHSRWIGRYGNYGGYNGYPYYRGYSGWSRSAGYPRGWGGYGWYW
jgi:hypothetical protein